MKMKSMTRDNALYFLVGVVATIFFARVMPTSMNYDRGVDDIMQEAYENGLAERFILPDNTVGFRWIETHKLGYE